MFHDALVSFSERRDVKMGKTNNDVKQEHYVPKSYLAWFADDHGKINVYDYKKWNTEKNSQ